MGEGKAQVTVSVEGQKEILGFPSIPGEQMQSTIVCTKCTKCSHVGPTRTEVSWSMKSCLCIYCCGGYWGLWQLLKGKDFIPKDCKHYCGKEGCTEQLAHYQSCEEDSFGVKVTGNAEAK